MKYFIIYLGLILSIVQLGIVKLNSRNVVEIDTEFVLETLVVHAPDRIQGDLRDFLDELAFRESSGVTDTVSAIGMLGKYQFSPRTLRYIGYEDSIESFLSDEFVQDSMAVELLKRNRRSLRNTIQEFDHTWYNGIYVTKSGILAGAHLVGAGGVWSFFYPETYEHATKDGNGVVVEQYIKQFSNYEFRLM